MIEVNSIVEFVNRILKESSKLVQDGGNKNEKLYFRGQSDCTYELMPAIGRGRISAGDSTLLNEERNLIEMAQNRRPDIFRHDLQPIELLALLQHYGIPTRLLDVTENPLVALYFACCPHHEKREETAGEVIVFKKNELHTINYPIIQAIADTYRIMGEPDLPLSTFYRYVSEQPYFAEFRSRCEDSFINKKATAVDGIDEEKINSDDEYNKEIQDWINECCKAPYLIYAPSRSMRQQAQQGCYLLFSNRINSDDEKDLKFQLMIDPISKDENTEQAQSNNEINNVEYAHDVIISSRIKIPVNAKPNIIENLKLFGISKRTLFPDDIDKLCEDITDEVKDKIEPNTVSINK